MPRVKPQSFTTTYNGLSRVLQNEVYISADFDPSSEKIKLKDHKAKKYKAIWDTGATGTAITQKVVDECALKPIGVVNVHTAAGLNKTNLYLINVWLPNKIIIPNVRATLGKMGTDVNVLIGMDIISKGDFAVTNIKGKTVFSFRFPSVECIDFVRNPFKPRPTRTIPKRRKRRR